jgi:Cu-Zn family superoxide dismutase
MTSRTLWISSSVVLLAVACGGSQSESAAPAAPTAEPAATAPTSSAPADTAATPAAPAADTAAAAEPAAPKTMSFDIAAKSGSKLVGKVTLTEQPDGVKVAIELAGVSPGDHAAHVHETPDCSAPDAKSAGSHYNPDQHPHGLPTASEHHLGDLGNITVGKDGKGKLEILAPGANLKAGDPHSFLNRSIIVHEKKDDGGQPVGNAGGRIGCVVLAP